MSSVYWTSLVSNSCIFNGVIMANVKQGNKTAPPQWWRHLRDWKRVFWKSERQAHKKDLKKDLS